VEPAPLPAGKTLAAEPEPAREARPAVQPPGDRREQKRREAAERQRVSAARKPLESRLKRIDEQMAKLAARKSALEVELADPALHGESGKDALKAAILDQAYVERELSALEAEWLELHDQLEQLEAAT
jgi:ATP-binding cassette subfamily F protein 3